MPVFNAFQSNALRACFNHNDNNILEYQFVSDINQVLAKLSTLNTKSSVVLYTTDTYEFAVYLFALALHGNAVILPSNGQPATLNSLLKQTPFFIGESELVADVEADFLDVGTLDNQPHFVSLEIIKWPEEGTIVFYTSGSSGKAKPIVKTWQVINKELSTLINSYALIDNPIFIASVSHQHIYGLLFRLLWPLRAGKVVNTELLHYPEHVAKKLRLFKKVVFVSSPAQLKRLCIDNVLVNDKSHLQWIFSSGGPLLNEDAISLFTQLNKPVTQVFGSTETGGIAYRQVTSLEKVSLWQPFSGIKVRALDDQRLILNSPLVRDKNYPLDDRGEVFKNGQFRLLGRFDRIIKLEEKRLSLDELEQHLCTSEWVSEAKVIALPGERLIVGAIVVLTHKGQMFFNSDGKLATNNLLKAHALARFERICIPKKWRFVEQLPYNSQAKLNLKALESLFAKVD